MPPPAPVRRMEVMGVPSLSAQQRGWMMLQEEKTRKKIASEEAKALVGLKKKKKNSEKKKKEKKKELFYTFLYSLQVPPSFHSSGAQESEEGRLEDGVEFGEVNEGGTLRGLAGGCGVARAVVLWMLRVLRVLRGGVCWCCGVPACRRAPFL